MLGIGPVALAPEVAHAATKEAQCAEVRKVADQTLQRLYKPLGARQAIQKAAGYAVFSNFGMKIFVAGGGKGEGVAVNTKTASHMRWSPTWCTGRSRCDVLRG
jgi:hypothetical protein